MRLIFTALGLIAGLALAAPASAEKQGTVVELFTSQGCSSCPPADALLAELAHRDDVIALALHVDYWDYIGWADDLADPAFTRRQRAYARAAGGDTIYTPQMVIGGVDHVVGSRPMAVMETLLKHAQAPSPVDVTLMRRGGTLTVTARATPALAREAVVQLVRYAPVAPRDIGRGENAGKRVTYVNAVTSWTVAGRWEMSEPLTLELDVPGDLPVAVIVQDGTTGPILGAAALE